MATHPPVLALEDKIGHLYVEIDGQQDGRAHCNIATTNLQQLYTLNIIILHHYEHMDGIGGHILHCKVVLGPGQPGLMSQILVSQD